MQFHSRDFATVPALLMITIMALILPATSQPASASGVQIGTVTRQQADATVIRNGETITLAVNRVSGEARTGLNLTGADVPPGEVRRWSENRINAARASVPFN